MRRELIAVGVASVALTIWSFWPLPLHLADHTAYLGGETPGVTADFDLLVWILSWDSHALLTAPWRIFAANMFYPSPWPLAYSEHLFGLVPLFAPWYWITGNSILSANLVILTTQVLSALAMYAFARRWTPAAAAAVGAFFFGYSGMRLTNASYFHIHSVQFLPIVLLFTERWLDRQKRGDWVVLTGALVLQALTSVYLAYIVFVTWSVELYLTLWFRRGRLSRRSVLGLALAAGVVLGAFAAACLPYLELRRLGVIPSFDEVASPTSPTEMGLVPVFAAYAVKTYFAGESVGLVGGLLVLLGLWQPDADRRRAAVLGVALAGCGALLAFGPGIFVAGRVLWSPYRILRAVVPGFATIRIPSRFLLIAELGLALLASLGTARLFELARLRGALLPPAAVVLVAASLVLTPRPPLPLHEELVGDRVPTAYRWLSTNGAGRPLLELPRPDLRSRARRMFLSTYHWLPTIDGYSAYPVRTAGYLYGIALGLPDEAALQALVDNVDVGWVLVHLDEVGSPERWLHGRLPSGLERAGRWQNDLLLRVTRPVDHDMRARLVSSTETIGGAALVPLAGPCPGRITLRSSPTVSSIGGTSHLIAEVRNDSSSTWPGFALLPRHVVHLRARLMGSDERVVGQVEVPLPRDLGPGEVAQVRFAMPIKERDLPGDLVLELIQLGDASLAGCGTAPLTTRIRQSAKAPA